MWLKGVLFLAFPLPFLFVPWIVTEIIWSLSAALPNFGVACPVPLPVVQFSSEDTRTKARSVTKEQPPYSFMVKGGGHCRYSPLTFLSWQGSQFLKFHKAAMSLAPFKPLTKYLRRGVFILILPFCGVCFRKGCHGRLRKREGVSSLLLTFTLSRYKSPSLTGICSPIFFLIRVKAKRDTTESSKAHRESQ